MNQIKVGLFLQNKRQEKNIHISEIAKRFNVTVEEVEKWESGKEFPNPKELPLLANMLGVTMDELFKGESKDKKMSSKTADVLVMFSAVTILAAIASFLLLRTINLEVSIMSAVTFVSIGIMTLLYVALKTE